VRDTLLWHYPNSLALESTIRIGDYKLIRNYDHVGDPDEPALELFRLYETKDGSQHHRTECPRSELKPNHRRPTRGDGEPPQESSGQ